MASTMPSRQRTLADRFPVWNLRTHFNCLSYHRPATLKVRGFPYVRTFNRQARRVFGETACTRESTSAFAVHRKSPQVVPIQTANRKRVRHPCVRRLPTARSPSGIRTGGVRISMGGVRNQHGRCQGSAWSVSGISMGGVRISTAVYWI